MIFAHHVTPHPHPRHIDRRTLPFLLLPLDPTPPEPFPSAPWLSPEWSKADPDQPAPRAPAGWTKYRPNEVWDLRSGEEEHKPASGGWLRGWLSRKDRNLEEQQPKVEVRVVLAVPPIQSWPRNQPIPFHLTATATASSPYSSTTSTSAPPPTPPTDIDLSDLVPNFQLFQKIRVVAKGSYEDYDTVRQSSAVAPEKGQDNVGNDGDDENGNGLVSGSAKYRGGDFSVHAPDQWATEWRRSEGGGGDANAWVSEKVVVGSFKVGMLPSFVNGGLSIKYGLKLELLLLSTLSKQTFSLVQPVISSGLHRGGLPAYDDNEEGERDDGGLVPPAYWDIEDLGGGKNE
ncbi:hypothetical protein QFC24_006507 [Naganishia onofrii]|uniref:Uncharacterized protein n=1 Tax=Naganishia onofrii TaxID=1851511 RepID=A0ACC2X1A0_9TREE|nr:hypothetical protein QFC24_006507 [Naganishia onofrii]